MNQNPTLAPAAAIAAAAAMLDQTRAFLEKLTPAQYTTPCAAMFHGTIGQHVRHALDHFTAALAALDGATIDYDHRARETPIERDPAAAVRTIDALLRTLRSISAPAADQPVCIRVMLTGDGDECELNSTLAREFAFAAHHAIHHNAMMVTIAQSMGIQPPKGFGKAPSTIDHERRAAAHA